MTRIQRLSYGVSLVSFAALAAALGSVPLAAGPPLWSASAGTGTPGVTDLSFSPDGRRIAASSWDRTVRLFQAQDGAVLHVLRCAEAVQLGEGKTPVFAVAFSPDSQYVAVGIAKSKRDAAQIWRVSDGTLVRSIAALGYVSSVRFSPDGKILAAAQHRTISLYNVTTGELVRELKGHTHNVFAIDYSSDGRWIASASFDKTVRVWNVQAGQQAAVISQHQQPVEAVVFSPDGMRIFSAGKDQVICVSKLEVGDGGETIRVQTERRLTAHQAPVVALALSKDGRWLASGSGGSGNDADGERQNVRIWSVGNGFRCHVLQPPHAQSRPIQALAFSPDGQTLAVGRADTVEHWRLSDHFALR